MAKYGGVCIYFRNYLPLKILKIDHLQESITFELQIGSKICKFVFLYQVVALKNLHISLSLHLDTLAKCNWRLIVALKTST